MKIYQNPQPHAVERVSKIKNQKKPSNLAGAKHDKKVDEHDIEKPIKRFLKPSPKSKLGERLLKKINRTNYWVSR